MAFNKNKSLAKAQKSLQKGKVADAIKEYQLVVDNDPTDIRTLLKIGDLQAKIGNVESANDTYRKVAEHYAKDGFFLKAVAVFKQILKLDPGLISVYLRLAELYQQLGLNSEAMKQYQVVVKNYENQGLKKESLDVLKKMAELDPENTANKVKLAELYAKEGHGDSAKEQLQTVAKELKAKGNIPDMIRIFEKMELMGVADENSKLELSEVLLESSEPKKALATLQSLFETQPKNVKVLELLAKCFVELQQPEKARSVYQELVQVLTSSGPKSEKIRIEGVLQQLQAKAPATKTSVKDDLDMPALDVDDPGLDELVPDDAVVTAEKVSAKKEKISSPAPQPKAQDAKVNDVPKVLSEVDVFLKYGLIDKACETLSSLVLAYPGSEPIREKLIAAFEAKKDAAGLIVALEAALAEAKSQNQNAAAQELMEEIKARRGQAPLAVKVDAAPTVKAQASSTMANEVEASSEAGFDLEFEDSFELEVVDDEVAEEKPLASFEQEEEMEIQELESEELMELDSDSSVAGEEVPIELDALSLEPEVGADLSSETPEVEPLSLDEDQGFERPDEGGLDLVALELEESSESNIEVSEPSFGAVDSPFELSLEEDAEPEDVKSIKDTKPPKIDLNFSDADLDGLGTSEVEDEEKTVIASNQDKAKALEALFEGTSSAQVDDIDLENIDQDELSDSILNEEEPDNESREFVSASVKKIEVEEENADSFDPFSSEMDEADFFISEGLLEEAVDIYRGILEQDPSYAKAKEKLSEIQVLGSATPKASTKVEVETTLRTQSKSSQRVLREIESHQVEESEALFDLSSELQDEIQDLEQKLMRQKDVDEEEEYLSPEEVIAEFKRGIARTVAKDDHQTHYNLGIAYKEMGLLDEAIAEFELASNSDSMSIDCASMIGLCLIGKKDFAAAVDVYRKALASVDPRKVEALGLAYELAEAHIGNGNLSDAYKLFARIRDVDPTFRDVRRRAKELELDLGDAAPVPSAPEKPESSQDESEVEISQKKNKISYI